MTGDQWAKSHCAAWQTFLEQKLRRCECKHPRTSKSNRRVALKQDEGEGIAPRVNPHSSSVFCALRRSIGRAQHEVAIL